MEHAAAFRKKPALIVSSTTAQVTALARAALSIDAGPVRDEYALLFLGAPWRHLLPLLRTRLAAWPWFRELLANVGGRTCYFDDAIHAAISRGVAQVVIVGAGYDSRALRMARKGRRFFEVDRPDTQSRKQAVIQGFGLSTTASFVAADLHAAELEEGLLNAGLDPTRSSFFLCEGLVEYLNPHDVQRTLRILRKLAGPGSVLGLDPLGADQADRPAALRIAGQMAARWARETRRFRIAPSDLDGFLRKEGWQLVECLTGQDLFDRYLASHCTRPRFQHNYVALAVPATTARDRSRDAARATHPR